MKPARLDLDIVSGATNRKPLWFMQPKPAWRPIETIHPEAPLRLTVPAHGLSGRWPVWLEGVERFPSLNSDKDREVGRNAEVVDADTIVFPDINGLGTSASGGVLVYRLPVDLTGTTASMKLRLQGQTLELTTQNGGLVFERLGVLTMVLTAEQSGALPPGRGSYDLDLLMSNGDTIRWLAGEVVVSSAGVCSHG